jgi:hypothetical protein
MILHKMFYFEKFAEKAFIVYGNGTRIGEDDIAVFAVVALFLAPLPPAS